MDLLTDPHFQKGLQQSLQNDFAGAIASFEAAAVDFPDSEELHYEIGLAYQRRAELTMPAVLRLQDPGTEPLPPRLSSSLGGMFNAFIGLAAVGAAKAVGQTGWIVQYRADLRNSAAALDRSIAIDPGYAPAYYALAHTLRYLGQTEQAARQAHKAAELVPGNRHYLARSTAIGAGLAATAAERAQALTWNDVILPERTKRELRQMQLLLEQPSLSRELGIEPPTGLLLSGPPGTGKTTIARVLAHESKCRFFSTTPADINTMWLGESEKQVARLFAQARAHAPSIVFLDEIDALLPSRSGGVNMYSDKIVNQFLHEMDGMTRNLRVFVIGATNRRDMLDPALLRGGRLSREIDIPLPDLAARTALFALATRYARLSEGIDLKQLAQWTDGYSGASIKALVNEAGLQALIRLADLPDTASVDRRLSIADFEQALTNFKPQDDAPPPGNWRLFG